MADQRMTLLIDGEVQGVGYRALVRKAGRELKLTGYVQNLDDGWVKVVAEGDTARLAELELAINVSDPLIEVESIERNYGESTGEFSGFVVKFADLERECRWALESFRRTILYHFGTESLSQKKANIIGLSNQ